MNPPDLQDILDAVLDGVIVVSDEGAVVRVNAEACRILETSAEHLAGTPIDRLLGADHPLPTLVAQVRRTRRAAIADAVHIPRRFGTDIEVELAVSALGEGGAARSVVVALRDHTVRNSLSQRAEQRDQLARYGHIAAGIAHEVKNPLGGIRGAAELLGRWSESDRSRDTADLIVREVDRIAALVDELMVFARGDQLKTEPVNVHRVLDGVLQLLGMDPLSAGSDVERLYDPSIPELIADPDRLTQIFLNLARNAMQAMEDGGGGTLEIRTRVTLDQRLTNSEGQQIPTVLVTVSDAGPGIAPDVLERLATPFFTTRAEGVGLGLAVARHWVSRHNGTLRIQSQLGEGTQVQVALPLYGPQAAQEQM